MRPQEFDEQRVLNDAMQAFRAAGYAATSVRDLERATGLTTGSLYHGFGGKEGLFERALAHYHKQVVSHRLERYLPGIRTPRAEVEALFTSTFDDKHGCLLTNTALEAQALSKRTQTLVRSGIAMQRRAFLQVMARLRPLPSKNIQAQRADVLLTSYHGILLLVRQGERAPALRTFTRSLLAVVFPSPQRSPATRPFVT